MKFNLLKQKSIKDVLIDKENQLQRDIMQMNRAYLLELVDRLSTSIRKGNLSDYVAIQTVLTDKHKSVKWHI